MLPGSNALVFRDGDELIRRNIGETLPCAAGPGNFHGCDDGILAKAERQSKIALRAVAGAAVNGLPLFPGSAFDAHHRPDRASI